ncbi:hypothetical protein N9089_01585 [Crocinitomicaceae bacterium]|nr:hypothetical protein [Crocinitomicaceae bacterium]
MTDQGSIPRRRWTQSSLRTLLTITLVVAAFFAGRVSVRPELERLRAAELKAIGQLLEAQIARQDAEGARIVAEERVRVVEAQASAVIGRLMKSRHEQN